MEEWVRPKNGFWEDGEEVEEGGMLHLKEKYVDWS